MCSSVCHAPSSTCIVMPTRVSSTVISSPLTSFSYASWVPHLSDFGLSVTCDDASEEVPVAGTLGYLDPEYFHAHRLNPGIDVYSLGVLMLEVLTGKKTFRQAEGEMNVDLASFALPIIEADDIQELLDRRLVREPTPWQLQALKRVVQIARCCVKFARKDRPDISGVVVNLKAAHEQICRDEPCSDDVPGLWPFLEKVDNPPDSPHATVVPSADYYSDLEPEVLEDGR